MYDTMIIGSDLSSLIAALTSIRQGMETLLVTERDPVEAYCEGGYTFSANPIPLAGIGTSPSLLRILEGLQLFPEGLATCHSINPVFQVILPGHRLDIFHERERMIGDLIREFPTHGCEINRFYRAVEKGENLIDLWMGNSHSERSEGLGVIFDSLTQLPSLISVYRSFRRPVNLESRALWAVLEAQLAVFSCLDVVGGRMYPPAAAYPFSLPWRGLVYPAGGRNDLMKRLYRQFEEKGGTLIKGCEVIRLDTAPDVMADVESTGGHLNLRSRRLIVSAQWEKVNSFLLEQKGLQRLKRLLKSVQCTGYPFSLHMGVREEAIPERMAPYTAVVLDEMRPIAGRNLVFLDTSLPGEPKRAPSGKRSVTATVFLPDSSLTMRDEDLNQVASDMLVSLEGVLPFLRENIDYIHVERSIAFSRISQEAVGLKFHFRKGTMLGLNTFSPKTPLPHLFLTGGMLRAGLGFEGEILSGLQSALLASVDFKTPSCQGPSNRVLK